MVRNEVNQSNSHYQKPGFWTCAGGILAGGTVKGIINVPVKSINPRILEGVKKISQLPKDEFSKVSDGIEKAFLNSGLKDKGVEILRTTSENAEK